MYMGQVFLSVEKIYKSFTGVHALNGVSLKVNKGEIHCLAGENGSGKSTLIKIIAGVERPDSGQIVIEDKKYHHLHPIDAIHEGIQVIYQDFSLFPNLTVAENLALNSQLELRKKLVDWKQVNEIAEKALQLIDVDINLKRLVENLSVADKQLVAIARALVQEAKLVIMDEPTTALTQKEVERLFRIIKSMQKRGIATLFVSHKLREVLEISERLTILRNGQQVVEGDVAEFDETKITFYMTGRNVSTNKYFYEKKLNGENAIISVKNLSKENCFEDVTFDLQKGEVLGITGLLGSGRTELALALFGYAPADSGEIFISGEKRNIKSIQDAMQNGIAYVPEDRLNEGLFMKQAISKNIYVGILDNIKNALGLINISKADEIAESLIKSLSINADDSHLPVQTLSGGNQQRVVLARWLSTNAKLIILNGPTVGVDIGSKTDILEKIKQLAKEGLGIIIISDDIPELVQTCSRILVMHKGKMIRTLKENEIEESAISNILNSLD
jgi:simple sugar transport system ATP-binding protein